VRGMPKSRKKNKEIAVADRHFRPQERTLLGDTTGIEALDVFKTAKKIGRLLSSFMIVAGTFFFLLSAISILISIEIVFSSPFFIGALAFLGAMNIFCGLILLAKK
jgi:hypothetical protein